MSLEDYFAVSFGLLLLVVFAAIVLATWRRHRRLRAAALAEQERVWRRHNEHLARLEAQQRNARAAFEKQVAVASKRQTSSPYQNETVEQRNRRNALNGGMEAQAVGEDYDLLCAQNALLMMQAQQAAPPHWGGAGGVFSGGGASGSWESPAPEATRLSDPPAACETPSYESGSSCDTSSSDSGSSCDSSSGDSGSCGSSDP